MDYLFRSGVAHDENPPGRGSGRYPYGSGATPHQHELDFLNSVRSMRKKGQKDSEIAAALLGVKRYDKKTGDPVYYSSSDLSREISLARMKEKEVNRARVIEMVAKCGSVNAAAKAMGKNEATLRGILKEDYLDRNIAQKNITKSIKDECDKKRIVDIGTGVNIDLGCNENMVAVAVRDLEKQGYKVRWVEKPQLTTKNKTTIKVLTAPGVEAKEAWVEGAIKPLTDYSPDNGATIWKAHYPAILDSKRVYIRYADDNPSGADRDGVIELRKGVPDVSLGNSNYAQVRINVDNKAFMKGMAIYSDDIPKGYDVIYNTNKKRGTKIIPDTWIVDNVEDMTAAELKRHNQGEVITRSDLKSVMKPLNIDVRNGQIDEANPFKAVIKAGGQDPDNPNNVINKIQEEGDWNNWSKTLSSQFLSKQPMKLIKNQLDLTSADKRVELDEIKQLNNPYIKQKLLENFAGQCDTAANSLAANGFKNQAYQCILPISIKETEIYAPNYNDGDTVALIRYPHQGTFEIPILKVNNKNKNGKTVVGNSKDAVGISPATAEQLSGADFDGDFVAVIPLDSNNIKVQSTKLKGDPLKGWDEYYKKTYRLPDDHPGVSNANKQREMGITTNLLMDMTLGGASEDEIVRVTKQAMVVIDAEKHRLDMAQSAKDLGINELKNKWQSRVIDPETGKTARGASTIITKAGSDVRVPERKEFTNTKEMTPAELRRWNNGDIVYRETGTKAKVLISDPEIMTDTELERFKSGRRVFRESDNLVLEKVKGMSTVDDAMELVRDKTNPKELAYAKFANEMKDMAREARRESRNIKTEPADPAAKRQYAAEVESIKKKIKDAKANSPRERQALEIANAMLDERKKANPYMSKDRLKREKNNCMMEARAIVGAKKKKPEITDREYEAIQARAVGSTIVKDLINNMDQDQLMKLAMPKREKVAMTKAQVNLAKGLLASGNYTWSELAERFGVSVTTVRNELQ